jgi:hypothetical protein
MKIKTHRDLEVYLLLRPLRKFSFSLKIFLKKKLIL